MKAAEAAVAAAQKAEAEAKEQVSKLEQQLTQQSGAEGSAKDALEAAEKKAKEAADKLKVCRVFHVGGGWRGVKSGPSGGGGGARATLCAVCVVLEGWTMGAEGGGHEAWAAADAAIKRWRGLPSLLWRQQRRRPKMQLTRMPACHLFYLLGFGAASSLAQWVGAGGCVSGPLSVLLV